MRTITIDPDFILNYSKPCKYAKWLFMRQGEISKVNVYFNKEIMIINFNDEFIDSWKMSLKDTIKVGTCLITMFKNRIIDVKFNLNNFPQEFRDFMEWVKLLEQKQNCQEDKIYFQILYNVLDQNKECLLTPAQ